MNDRPVSSRPRRLIRLALVSTAAAAALAVTFEAVRLPLALPAHADAVRVEGVQMPSFADVVDAVSPAVVSVRVESEIGPVSRRDYRFDRRDRRFEDEFPDLPRFFREHPFFRDGPYGERERDRQPRRFGRSQGSGFFVSEDGYLVTNHHVVAKGSKFTVVMDNGDELEASLVGADARSDLAVLKVNADRTFTYVRFSDQPVRIGDWVVAVGNPFGLGGTVTAGIVSARNREIGSNRYDDFIQIDAAVNKGNSGGPAFNLNGEVVGINTAIFSPSGGNIGIAFAIPAATAKDVVADLIANGKVVRGWLGVQIQPVTGDIADSLGLADANGAIVTAPQDDSPAAKAGIRAGDVITAVNGDKVANPRELARRIGRLAPDSKVTIALWRDGKSQDVEVTIGRLEGDVAAARPGDRGIRSLARVGLEVQPAEDGAGVVVVDVVPGSGADRRGVRVGDTILAVNGEAVTSADDIVDILRDAEGRGRNAALFQIRRDADTSFVAIPFGRG